MQLKKLLPLFILFALPFLANAQVTTGSITGKIITNTGSSLGGATVTATHTPSGTIYRTISNSDGLFTLPGVRTGGPYVVTVQYVGYVSQKIEDINVQLGESYDMNIDMEEATTTNQDVIVTAVRKGISLKTGATTVITTKQLQTLPTISRSITDFTRLTPQAYGNNFGGRDGRYNNLQVDGVNLNNNFGLSSDLAPGSGNPISLDALSEVSVNIAPYDVRQSGFTGAGINVATKSGTNEFHGSAYTYLRNQDFYGYKIDGKKLTKTPNSNHIYGVTIGGPIIKNKLFFFVSAETEKGSAPGITWVADGSKNVGNKSSTSINDLKKVYDFVKQQYNYDLGAYDNFPNFDTKNTKLLGKIDWNINDANKLTVKYSDYSGNDVSPLNASSVPQNATVYVTGQAKGVTRMPNSRFSAASMAFNSSNYQTNHIVRTGSLELNSRLNNQMSNQFLATYTHVSDIREPVGGKVFPFVDIFDGAGQNFISLGTDPFTNNNQLINNVLNIIDNFTYYAGKHTITAGISYERQKVGNMFMAGSQGHYVFNSLDDFLNEKQPAYYGYTYSLVPGESQVFSANLIMSQLGIYAQDEYNVNAKFKLTYGLRVDMPIYGEKPIDNPSIDSLSFPNANGKMIHYNTGSWPKNTPLFSPRVGFNWDVDGDKSLIVRGGTGIFSGRIPFVFLTNMPSNSGVYQNAVALNTKAALDAAGVTKFNPDINAYANSSAFPTQAQTTTPPASFVIIDPNFKFPQIWRTNLGADKHFGNGFTATVDIMYTKDIHAVKMRNPNLKAPTDHLSGEDDRPYYPTTPPTYYSGIGTPIVLENTSKGNSFSATAQLSKSFKNGLYGSIAYTYSKAKEVSPNPGSRATSAWQAIANVNGPNDDVLDNSQYAIPHRIVANFSYRKEYAKHFATTLSLFYQGSSQSTFSYVINGSIVGDGNSELMYIYNSGKDVPFVPILNKDNSVKYTVEQQEQAYDNFINSSPYLSKHKDQYASRNTGLTPWLNQLDARLLQDFFIKVGKTTHSLQLSLDILNLPNLISNKWANWGYARMYTVANPLVLKGVVNGTPTYNLNQFNGELADQAYSTNLSQTAAWRMQLGIRYTF